jgi:hypothetical protein
MHSVVPPACPPAVAPPPPAPPELVLARSPSSINTATARPTDRLGSGGCSLMKQQAVVQEPEPDLHSSIERYDGGHKQRSDCTVATALGEKSRYPDDHPGEADNVKVSGLGL